jgi:hypothetical protein
MADYLRATEGVPDLKEWMHEVFTDMVEAYNRDDGYTVGPDDAPRLWHLCEV